MSTIANGGQLRARSDMGATSRVLDKDDELGKRDENHWRHKPSGGLLSATPLRWRKRRILVTLAFFLVSYTLFQALPSDLRRTPRFQLLRNGEDPFNGDDGLFDTLDAGETEAERPKATLPPPKDTSMGEPYLKHYYNDILKFYKLPRSLQQARRAIAYHDKNRNVLFAASNQQSVSKLVGVACEMTRWNKNRVHMVVFGRDSISVEQLKEINGADPGLCDMYWHDARPDYAEYSSDLRAETGATFAFKNLNEFLRPQVLITDELDMEDDFFRRAVRAAVQHQHHPLIEIPQGAEEKLEWMIRLDIESLKAWNSVSVDVLIHAPPAAIGSLRRLLKSLSNADYRGLGYPRLIIELPLDIDHMTRVFLNELKWPPVQGSPRVHQNLLIVRHRIPSKRMSADLKSVRFAESFFPTNSRDSHVLVVSPGAEFSPLYYHYVKYHILEYVYGDNHFAQRGKMFGFSLEVPPLALDGSTVLMVPTTAAMQEGNVYKPEEDSPTPFMWEAPNSGAALYFGDKWEEIQSFMTNRMSDLVTLKPKPKQVSATLPAWMEYFAELMSIRGYAMLYPALESEQRLVTVHADSSRVPEEFASPPAPPSKRKRDTEAPAEEHNEKDQVETFIAPALPPESETFRPDADSEDLLSSQDTPLHLVLPFDAALPKLHLIPHLSPAGQLVTVEAAASQASRVTEEFRMTIGGCDKDPLAQAMAKAKRKRITFPGNTRDLFCWGLENEDDYEPPPAEPTPTGTNATNARSLGGE